MALTVSDHFAKREAHRDKQHREDIERLERWLLYDTALLRHCIEARIRGLRIVRRIMNTPDPEPLPTVSCRNCGKDVVDEPAAYTAGNRERGPHCVCCRSSIPAPSDYSESHKPDPMACFQPGCDGVHTVDHGEGYLRCDQCGAL